MTDKAQIIKDANSRHWVYRAPPNMQPYLQLSRLDRPIGYWLLTLPGWIGLAFASLSYGFDISDLKWAVLILIGAIAMRGAGCTYNDIVDQDLDAQVERTALRPLPAGTVSTKAAWVWLFMQCAVGLVVLLCLPRIAQIISLCSIPLVAAYPFMKRITWFPQVWLGLTFNWAVLVAYAAKTGEVSLALFPLYLGLIFWTVGYDTIYACQDIEDDAMIGVKSTARRFGGKIRSAVIGCYAAFIILAIRATETAVKPHANDIILPSGMALFLWLPAIIAVFILLRKFQPPDYDNSLSIFKSNWIVAALFIASAYAFAALSPFSP